MESAKIRCLAGPPPASVMASRNSVREALSMIGVPVMPSGSMFPHGNAARAIGGASVRCQTALGGDEEEVASCRINQAERLSIRLSVDARCKGRVDGERRGMRHGELGNHVDAIAAGVMVMLEHRFPERGSGRG